MSNFLTSGPLPANTFAAGTPGVVEDKITMNANGALVVDGQTIVGTSHTVNVKDEATSSHNGEYSVSVAGDGTHQAVLIRVQSQPVVGGVVSPDVGIKNAFSTWEFFSVPSINQGCYSSGSYNIRLVSPQINPGLFGGFAISNNAGSPNTQLDITSGLCCDSLSSVLLYGDTMTKDLSASWASGSGNGGLFSGSVAANTVYHVFAVRKDSDRSVDYGFDTDVNASHIPAGYTCFRRIGSVITDGSSHIRAFTQHGDEFWWNTSVLDVDVTNPGTSATLRTLTVPTGVQVKAIVNVIHWTSAGYDAVYTSAPETADLAPAYTTAVESATNDVNQEAVANVQVWTNTSGQIRTRAITSTAALVLRVRTLGYIDARGK